MAADDTTPDKVDRTYEVAGIGQSQSFPSFPAAMRALVGNSRAEAVTMKTGSASVPLVSTSWENDGSTPVKSFYSAAVREYDRALRQGTSEHDLGARERAAQADVDAWPKPPERAAPVRKVYNSRRGKYETVVDSSEPEPERRHRSPASPRDKSRDDLEGPRNRPSLEGVPSQQNNDDELNRRRKEGEAADLTLPAQLERKYLRVGGELFRSGRDDRPDLSLKGKDGIRINKDHAIGDAVAIAKHNGWQTIRVNGSDDFKKAVYLEASRAGLEVTGYKPTPQLKLEGERLAARDKAREAQDPAKAASMAKKDPSEARTAADQFRRNSHRENAANPQFQAAQSHVLAASIEARTRFPEQKDRDRFIEKVKEAVAKRLESGSSVQAARFQQQQRQNEAERLTRENTVLRQPERSPSRTR
ncbi:LPD7 domain-containing protein [Novosphingobium sp. RD2P27]|uniref:LPD7 domain-containing protein n=1 Tax=Novosphingobium kalidii TaxID=3230299 RepID=A0ABV2D3R0_9SPHN